MSARREEMNSAEIEQIVAQRVANAIEAIVAHETTLQSSRDNRVQQPSCKRPNGARTYTARTNEKKAYAGSLPYYNKEPLWQNKLLLSLAMSGNGGHVRSDCPKTKNQNHAKYLWAAIKSRFGGNDESKKMQRNVLKHQIENFTTAPNESLDKAYDRFQKLISQLEVHAAPISKEDINQKFLRSLPPSWSQIALIMINKLDIDQTDIDDLYNNLRVYEDEMKRSLSSTSNSQNLSFLSSENTSSTNEVSPTSGNFGVNNAGGTSSSSQVSSTPGADEVVCSFFAQQTTSPPLDNRGICQQIDQDVMEGIGY
ncbi:hypothetical protein Tco_0053645 [Tanacetum coccineum]